MDPKTLARVVAQIHSRYPEFDGCKPRLRKQAALAADPDAEPVYLLTFQKSGQVKSGSGTLNLPRILRVVVNSQGKIQKVSTSR
jgi:hypothetical protein